MDFFGDGGIVDREFFEYVDVFRTDEVGGEVIYKKRFGKLG